MFAVYLNYPNPKISAHRNKTIEELAKHDTVGQRHIPIITATLSQELLKFGTGQYRFAASPHLNDMWIDLDFNDPDFEIDVLKHIQRLLGKRYTPFASVQIELHD